MNAVTLEIDRPDNDTSGTAFTRLLQWLDEGADSHGERYLEMRRRLVAYFDRRNRSAPDMLADETFDRVCANARNGGTHQGHAAGALLLRRRTLRAARRHPTPPPQRAVDERMGAPLAQPHRACRLTTEDADPARQSLACLGRCLGPPENRRSRADRRVHYRDAKRERVNGRRALAAALGITMNALGIRAWRLRASLEACVGACSKGVLKDFGRGDPNGGRAISPKRGHPCHQSAGNPLRDDEIIRYLLGELPDDDAERLDEQSVVDDDFASRLRARPRTISSTPTRAEPAVGTTA